MTTAQLKWFNTALWPRACWAQGWAPNDRANKLRVVSGILGRDLTTTKDVGIGEEFDKLKNELHLLANPGSLNAALATIGRDGSPSRPQSQDGRDGVASLPTASNDQRRRWLHKLKSFDSAYVAKLTLSFSKHFTEDPNDLDDRKLKAVVVTCEQRARKNPEIRRNHRDTENTETESSSAASVPSVVKSDLIPFSNQF
jgi:hypothetical protein